LLTVNERWSRWFKIKPKYIHYLKVYFIIIIWYFVLHIMFIIPHLHVIKDYWNSIQFKFQWEYQPYWIQRKKKSDEFNSRQNLILIQLNLNSIQWTQIEFRNLNPNSKSSCMQWHSIFPQNEFLFHQIFIVMVMQNNVEPKGDKGLLK